MSDISVGTLASRAKSEPVRQPKVRGGGVAPAALTGTRRAQAAERNRLRLAAFATLDGAKAAITTSAAIRAAARLGAFQPQGARDIV